MDKPSNWVVLTQRLGYCPEGWVKHLTPLLVENNPTNGFVHILLFVFNPAFLERIFMELGTQYVEHVFLWHFIQVVHGTRF